MNRIYHIDGETDPEKGMFLAADEIAAEVPEDKARALVAHLAKLIYMLSYIEQRKLADLLDQRVLSILRECFAAAKLPTLEIKLFTPQQ